MGWLFIAQPLRGEGNDERRRGNQRQAASVKMTKTENAKNRREADASLVV